MIKTVENFCKEKRIRFGYGLTEAAADDFFELGGGVFVITQRPRVGYTEGVVVTRGLTDDDRSELARRLRVNGSSANVDGSRINVRFRPARPFTSGGAGIGGSVPPVPPTEVSITVNGVDNINPPTADVHVLFEKSDGAVVSSYGLRFRNEGGTYWDSQEMTGDVDGEVTINLAGLEEGYDYELVAFAEAGGEVFESEIFSFFVEQPLTFVNENEEGGTMLRLQRIGTAKEVELEASLNGGPWIVWEESGTDNHREIYLREGSYFRIRNTSSMRTRFSFGQNNRYHFDTGSNTLAVKGDIRSLLQRDNYRSVQLMDGDFHSLFMGCGIASIPDILADEMAANCYNSMFKDCNLLHNVKIGGKTAKAGSLASAFSGCTALERVEIELESVTNTSLNGWLTNVAPAGVVVCPAELALPQDSPNGVPQGWTREDL